MKQTINFYDFRRAFEEIRPENFSPAGLKAFFEYIEEIEDFCDMEIELDVIALCCEYSEYDIKEIIQNYCLEDDIKEMFDIKEYEDMYTNEIKEYVLDYLYERTQVIVVNEDTVIIADF